MAYLLPVSLNSESHSTTDTVSTVVLYYDYIIIMIITTWRTT